MVNIKKVKSVWGCVQDSSGKPMSKVRVNYYLKNFSDDMENGSDNWLSAPNWTIIDSDYHSLNHCWTDSPGGTFDPNTTTSLTMSNNIHLGLKPVLRFWHHYDDGPPGNYNSLNVFEDIDGESPLSAIKYFNGTTYNWQQVEIPLIHAGDKNTKITFSVVSRTAESIPGDGWYIDDVFIGDHLGTVVTDPNGNYVIHGLEPSPGTVYRIYADVSSLQSEFGDVINLTDDVTDFNFTFTQPALLIDTAPINKSLITERQCLKALTIINTTDLEAPLALGINVKENGTWKKQIVLTDGANDTTLPPPNLTYVDISSMEASLDPANQRLDMSISLHAALNINLFNGDIYLDTDQNPATGKSLIYSDIGAEYILQFRISGESSILIEVIDFLDNSKLVGLIAVAVNPDGNQLSFSIPLKLIGDDGYLDLAGYFIGDVIPNPNPGFTHATISNGSWLTVTPSQGSLAPLASQEIKVKLNSAPDPTNPLAPGLYEGMVAVFSPDSLEQAMTIPVSLRVYPETFELPIFSDGFESGVLDPNIWTVETTAYGRVRVSNSYPPYSGSYSLLLDAYPSGTYARAAVVTKIDLGPYEHPSLSFYLREFSDETHTEDGVFISSDRINWAKIYSFDQATSIYQRVAIDLEQKATALGMATDGDLYLKFQFYDNYSIPSDGYGLDDIKVSSTYTDNQTTMLTDNFESGLISSTKWTISTTGNGRARINTAYPYSGTYHLILDSSTSGTYSYARISTCLNVREYRHPFLSFYVREFGDETDGNDGVYLSSNGTTWVRIYDYSQVGSVYQQVYLDLAEAAKSNGLGLGENLYVRFQYYDDYPVPTDGYAIDEIRIFDLGKSAAIFSETFDFRVLYYPNLWIAETTQNGRIDFSLDYMHEGIFSLTLDDAVSDSILSLAKVSTMIDLSDTDDPTLTFYVREFSDESHDQDGVFICDNWLNWTRIYDYSQVGSTFKRVDLDLVSAADQAGINLNEYLHLAFQFYDNCSITTDGYAIDDVAVKTTMSSCTRLNIGECSKEDLPHYFSFSSYNANDPAHPEDFARDLFTSSQVDSDANGDLELEFSTYQDPALRGRITYTYTDHQWTGIKRLNLEAKMGCQSSAGGSNYVMVYLFDETSRLVVKYWWYSASLPNTWHWYFINETLINLNPTHIYSLKLYASDDDSASSFLCRWEYVNAFCR